MTSFAQSFYNKGYKESFEKSRREAFQKNWQEGFEKGSIEARE